MRRRSRTAVVGFAASAALLAVGLAALTLAALRAERAESAALERSVLEEDVRLALWRMDAAFAAFLAAENSRPVDRFVSLEPAELAEAAPFVEGRFELAADGPVSAAGGRVVPEWLAGWVAEFESWPVDPPPAVAVLQPSSPKAQPPTAPPLRGSEQRQSEFSQLALNVAEYNQRSNLGSQAANVQPPPEPVDPPLRGELVRVEDSISQPLAAHWVGERLVLRRRVMASGQTRDQITWLDWQRLGDFLLAQSREVFPGAALMPAAAELPADPGRRLALLPARLDPGPRQAGSPVRWSLRSPMGGALAAAWGAMALALVGVGALLWGSLRLTRRREEFVSAVTHELRTPLTTFRLQSELLAAGMVPEGERQGHAETLHREADRLGHLVDNVLSFSRLEKGRWPPPPPTPLGEVLDPVLPLLEARASEAALELICDLPSELLARPVLADRERLERILFNLVDNACKYAAGSRPPAIELDGEVRGRRLALTVQDHGPGVPKAQRRNLFRPFHKSAEHATGSAPGVGLGLSLARRLARGLGGELALAPSEVGARFELLVRLG